MMSKQNEEKRAYWRGVLERQQRSGLSIRRFCKEHRVSEALFHSWKRKLVHTTDSIRPAEGVDPLEDASQLHEAAFIPVWVNAAAGRVLELVHPRGHVVRVPAGFDGGSLRQVLDALDRPGDQ